MPLLHEGSIKFYNATQGYGFIIPDDETGDVFFHAACIANAGTPTLCASSLLSTMREPLLCASHWSSQCHSTIISAALTVIRALFSHFLGRRNIYQASY